MRNFTRTFTSLLIASLMGNAQAANNFNAVANHDLLASVAPVLLITVLASGLLLLIWKRPIEGLLSLLFLVTAVSGDWMLSPLALPFPPMDIPVLHIAFWTPVLALLLMWRPFLDAGERKCFRVWSGVMTTLIIFSFVVDVREAAIYVDAFI